MRTKDSSNSRGSNARNEQRDAQGRFTSSDSKQQRSSGTTSSHRGRPSSRSSK